ncbi:hypothetical protein [Clostridium sp. MD294]|uniref:hypothetical protein n=1 Tax=Clostridium sp. MD294 TaxID=97138 RepID=UPI0002CA530F|nr:hypothetical protein [Clostridium sp. MD294]NDO47622.1 hypothetical protein [Clostridium sp. MD294]USF30060.1 hypothetical protein C820_001484 [Clostridium sp. MD294]
MSCYSEGEIRPVVLQIIRNEPSIRTNKIIDEARQIMKPSGDDLEILDKRNDDKFSQKVRNIRSHKSLDKFVTHTNENNCQWFPK